MDRDNPFERLIANLPEISPYKTALIEVTDAAYLARAWLAHHYLDHTAADAIALTALILARERQHEGE